jgi:hypothetical protein
MSVPLHAYRYVCPAMPKLVNSVTISSRMLLHLRMAEILPAGIAATIIRTGAIVPRYRKAGFYEGYDILFKDNGLPQITVKDLD